MKLHLVLLYICAMAEKVRVVRADRVVKMVAGDDDAIDLLFRLVVMLSERRAKLRG